MIKTRHFVVMVVALMVVGLLVAWIQGQNGRIAELEARIDVCDAADSLLMSMTPEDRTEEVRLETITPRQHYDQTWKSQEHTAERLNAIRRYTLETVTWIREQRGWKEQAENCTAEKLKVVTWGAGKTEGE